MCSCIVTCVTVVCEHQVCRGSHRLRAFERLRAYASSRVGADGTRSGWLSDDGADAAELCENSPAPAPTLQVVSAAPAGAQTPVLGSLAHTVHVHNHIVLWMVLCMSTGSFMASSRLVATCR